MVVFDGVYFFNLELFFLHGTHWFWTGTHDFSQDESENAT